MAVLSVKETALISAIVDKNSYIVCQISVSDHSISSRPIGKHAALKWFKKL